MPSVAAPMLVIAMSFLKKNLTASDRLTVIKRVRCLTLPYVSASTCVANKHLCAFACINYAQPLPSCSLPDALVPEWADAFVRNIPFGTQLLDLAETASFLRLDMLAALCCATIASKIKQGVCSDLFNADTRLSNEDEAKLKAQNEWAWEAPVGDMVFHVDDHDGTPYVPDSEADHASSTFEACEVLLNESEEALAAGLVAITKDCRITSQNTTSESFRLLSPLAGQIALFL